MAGMATNSPAMANKRFTAAIFGSGSSPLPRRGSFRNTMPSAIELMLNRAHPCAPCAVMPSRRVHLLRREPCRAYPLLPQRFMMDFTTDFLDIRPRLEAGFAPAMATAAGNAGLGGPDTSLRGIRNLRVPESRPPQKISPTQ